MPGAPNCRQAWTPVSFLPAGVGPEPRRRRDFRRVHATGEIGRAACQQRLRFAKERPTISRATGEPPRQIRSRSLRLVPRRRESRRRSTRRREQRQGPRQRAQFPPLTANAGTKSHVICRRHVSTGPQIRRRSCKKGTERPRDTAGGSMSPSTKSPVACRLAHTGGTCPA